MSSRLRISMPATFLILAAVLSGTAASGRPAERPQDPRMAEPLPTVPPTVAATAAADTLVLMGGPDRGDGKFQQDGNPTIPDDEGWVPFNTTLELKWHVDTVNAELLDPSKPDNRAMWCGAYFPACSPQEDDPNPGYGASWDEWLTWSGAVADPADTTLVTLTAMLNYDVEPGYDYVDFELAEPGGGHTTILTHWGNNMVGGVFEPVAVDETFAVPPSAYFDGEIHLRWRVRSDGAIDDSNCWFPSIGAAQIDNIAVSFDQGAGPVLQTYDDFQPGSPVHWTPDARYNCNNAKVWTGLVDGELCRQSNQTPQLAFINDGTGCSDVPSYGFEADYGPDGMVVDCTRLADDESSLLSPPITLPDLTEYETITVEYDAYVHGLENSTPVGQVTVLVSEDGGDTWVTHDWNQQVGFDRPYRGRYRLTVDGILDVFPAADTMRIKIGAERNSNYYRCTEGTPGPYFDNIAVRAVKHAGPHLTLDYRNWRDLLAVDAFPAAGTLDLANPGNNAVKVSRPAAVTTSVSVYAALVRHGAQPLGPPELHWNLKANPLFDAYRTNLPPNPVTGVATGDPVEALPHSPTEYEFTLPSTGFVFPGDELHYYFRMQDDVAGDIGTTILPADTTGFGFFGETVGETAGRYAQKYHMRALPSLWAAHPDSQPKILVWDDTRDRAFTRNISRSLEQLGYRPGRDYDIYQSGITPAGGLFNNTTSAMMAGYSTLIYSSGSGYQSLYSEEYAEFYYWLTLGNRNLLFMGDNLLETTTNIWASYLRTYMGVELLDRDVLPYIEYQKDARVVPVDGVPGFGTPLVANVELCESFDAVVRYDTGQTLLEFTDPGGAAGAYWWYPAGVVNTHVATGTRAITLPVAFDKLKTPADHTGGLSARTAFLGEVLAYFGQAGTSAPSGTADTPSVFRTRAYPNPFNPRTRVDYHLPRAGRLAIAIYDVRGRRERMLLDQQVPRGAGHVYWDGTDDRGRDSASGVYFYQLQLDGRNIGAPGKLALLK